MLTIQPFIHQKLSGEIWRLEIDEATGNLLLEVRNEAEKLVSFTSVDLTTGKLNFSNYTTPERWLTGMEAAFDGVLLLYNYQSANGPAHKGITAVDEISGDTLWSNYVLAFDHLSVNGPMVYNTQILPKKLYVADIKTGATTRLYNPIIDTEPVKDLHIPDILVPEQVPGKMPVTAYGNMVHYLEHNSFRIVSLHTNNEGQLNQQLFIMEGDDVIYKELLNTRIQKLQPEAFVLHKNWLICLKNKTELMVFDI